MKKKINKGKNILPDLFFVVLTEHNGILWIFFFYLYNSEYSIENMNPEKEIFQKHLWISKVPDHTLSSSSFCCIFFKVEQNAEYILRKHQKI